MALQACLDHQLLIVLVYPVAIQAGAVAGHAQSVAAAVLPDAIRQGAGACAAILGNPDIVFGQRLVVQAVANKIAASIQDAVIPCGLNLRQKGLYKCRALRVGQAQDARLILNVIRHRQAQVLALNRGQATAGLLACLRRGGGVAVPVHAVLDAQPFALCTVALKLRVNLVLVPPVPRAQHRVRHARIFDRFPVDFSLVLTDVDRVVNYIHGDSFLFFAKQKALRPGRGGRRSRETIL